MVVRRVSSVAQSPAAPDQVWEIACDFCDPWHPAIATMTGEQGKTGSMIRAFMVTGDPTTYREQLTYLSHTDRTMAYALLEGIAGVERYTARLVVDAARDGGSVIAMTAELSAPAPRADEIADGTKAIFDSGTAALSELAQKITLNDTPSPPSTLHTIKTQMIDALPRLAVSVAGAPSDTLVLFLHGIGGNRSNWDAQLQAIAPHCRAAALDLRGYGGSTLGSAPSTVDDYCDDISRVCTALGASKLILCGLSYGAWIATSFAMRQPDVLTGLVLSGGCTGMSEAGPDERDAFRLSREVPMQAGQSPADFAPDVVTAVAGPDAPPEVHAELHAAMSAIPTQTYQDALHCFTNPLERFDFSKIRCPVLLMTGAFDKLAPPAEIRHVAERIWDANARPDVRFEVIQNAGHVCNIEQPQAYNSALLDFVTRILP